MWTWVNIQEYKTQSQMEVSTAEAEQVRTQLEDAKLQISTLEANNTELLHDKVNHYYRLKCSIFKTFFLFLIF